MLTRDKLLGYVDTNIGSVDVEELGGKVGLATLTVAEMDQLTRLDDGKPASVAITILGACDEKGTRLFTDDDAAQLATLPAGIVSKISKAILTHNGMGPKAAEDAKNGSSETAS